MRNTVPISESRAMASASIAAAIEPELLTEKQAAALLGIGARTLWRYARSGRAPAPLKLGNTIRYSRGALMSWVAAGCPCINEREGA